MTGRRGVVGGTAPAPPHPKPSPWATEQAEKVREALGQYAVTVVFDARELDDAADVLDRCSTIAGEGRAFLGGWGCPFGEDNAEDDDSVRVLRSLSAELSSLKDALVEIEELSRTVEVAKVARIHRIARVSLGER